MQPAARVLAPTKSAAVDTRTIIAIRRAPIHRSALRLAVFPEEPLLHRVIIIKAVVRLVEVLMVRVAMKGWTAVRGGGVAQLSPIWTFRRSSHAGGDDRRQEGDDGQVTQYLPPFASRQSNMPRSFRPAKCSQATAPRLYTGTPRIVVALSLHARITAAGPPHAPRAFERCGGRSKCRVGQRRCSCRRADASAVGGIWARYCTSCAAARFYRQRSESGGRGQA